MWLLVTCGILQVMFIQDILGKRALELSECETVECDPR